MKWLLILFSLAATQAHALALSEDQAKPYLFELIPGEVKDKETLSTERSGRLDSFISKNCVVRLSKGGMFKGFSAQLLVNGEHRSQFDTAMRRFVSGKIESGLVEVVYERTQTIGGSKSLETIRIEKDNNNNVIAIFIKNKSGNGTCLFY